LALRDVDLGDFELELALFVVFTALLLFGEGFFTALTFCTLVAFLKLQGLIWPISI